MLAQKITATLLARGDRPAVGDRTDNLTYRQLHERSAAIAAAIRKWADESLSADLKHDRLRVGLLASNSIAYVETYIGLLMAGAVPFLIDSSFGREELRYLIDTCSLTALIHDKPLLSMIGAAQSGRIGLLTITATHHDETKVLPLLPDTEVCRFTSGSTGFPNCIEFSGAAVCAAAEGWVTGTALTADDRILCFAGLSNGLAFNTSLLPAFLAGAWVYFTSGLPNATKVTGLLAATRATRLTGFPALYESLVRRGTSRESVAGLRVAISAGARLNPETSAALATRCGMRICDYYGIAETGPLTFEPEPGCHRGLGLQLPGVTLAFQDTGQQPSEILAHSPSMASRYLNLPGVFERRLDHRGFYRTGDTGYVEDGRLFLVGRNTGALNIGGRKVDPIEIGRVLSDLPGVDDALVFSMTKANGDEMVVALVASTVSVDPAQLRSACKEKLASFKVPEQIYVVAGLPVNSVGKPRLEVARQMVKELSWSA